MKSKTKEHTVRMLSHLSTPAQAQVAEAQAICAETSQKESRHDKFVRLGNRRVKKVIADLRSLGKLGSNDYERTDVEVDKIATILVDELATTMNKLRSGMEAPITDVL